MSVNQIRNNRQRLIWSSIRNRLNISLHEENIINLIKLQEAQERLEAFLSFYTDGNKNEDLPNDLKFLNKYNITPQMKDFLIKISECLNMTRRKCFDLMDNYFFLHNEEFDKVTKLLNLIMLYPDRSSRRYENIKTDLEDKKNKIIEFYFKERKNLILFYLDIFYKIFLETENTPINLRNIMIELIRNRKLLDVFTKQLINYGDNENNINNNINDMNKIFNRNKFNNHYVRDIINKIPIYICEEQNMILELIIFILHEENININDSSVFEQLFNYFLKTHFFCYSQNFSFDNTNLKDEIMIKSLIIILNSFQPHIINKVLSGETNLLNIILYA